MYQQWYGAHVKEMQRGWETAMLAEHCDAILVHAGTPIISFLDDYQYPFRPNPHFLAWLPLTRHPESVLLIRPGERPLLWFYQPDDYWHVTPGNPESWWADEIEVRVVSDPNTWRSELPGAMGVVAALGNSAALRDIIPEDRINAPRLLAALHLQRTRKSDYEIACMQTANNRAAKSHVAAERAFREGKSEFDIHLDYLESCRQNDAALPYGSIVALNRHGAVLHYQQQESMPPAESRSFLIDAGCTVNAYASDITRTHAAQAGEFNDLITAMDVMQQALGKRACSGVDFRQLHLDTHLEIAGILSDAGVIRVSAEDAVSSGLSGVFFPHGLGHFIGLQTHDVAGLIDNEGEAIPRPEGHPFLRLTRHLEVGNVVTIEPGLYFIDSLLQQWKAEQGGDAIDWAAIERLSPFGGIRIEDNVYVGEQGAINLTRRAFAEV